jgi:CheY-like chemotaxis protein
VHFPALGDAVPVNKPKRILSVSTDANLAAARALTLADAGHTVTTKTSRMEAEQAIAAGEFDLLILGHTIASEDAIALTEAFRKVNPRAKVLAVAEGWFLVIRADKVVQMSEGPYALLSAIQDLDHDE